MGAGESGYFDWAATAPPALLPALCAPFGNPSSQHAAGREARAALEDARARCAAALGVPPETAYFTSGGTESNVIVIYSFLRRKLENGGQGALFYSAAEHPSVLENCLLLERLGLDVRAVGVNGEGRVTEAALESAFSKASAAGHAPAFAAIMAVNNETGSINDIPALVSWIRANSSRPVHIHADCVQALGKTPLALSDWGIDSASFSAHKLGGARGVGILYLKKPLAPLVLGGGQERGIRPGTENTAGALTFAAVIEKYASESVVLDNSAAAERRMRRLIEGLTSFPRCRIIPESRTASCKDFSPYILQAAFQGIPGEVFVRALSKKGFYVSTGSACSAGQTGRGRYVLEAMGISKKLQIEGVRISQGRTTDTAAIDALLGAIGETLRGL